MGAVEYMRRLTVASSSRDGGGAPSQPSSCLISSTHEFVGMNHEVKCGLLASHKAGGARQDADAARGFYHLDEKGRYQNHLEY